MTKQELRELEEAMWSGDQEKLWKLAPCSCCCHEHTWTYCLARLWNGCRSGLDYGDTGIDHDAWAKFYERERGMTSEQFYGVSGDLSEI